MMSIIVNWFTKITAWPFQKIIFRTRVSYEAESKETIADNIPLLIVSNHTSVYDYAAYLFVFFRRTLKVPMAEVIIDKFPLGIFLRMLGGIRVNRKDKDFRFLHVLEQELRKKNGTVLIFPESRIPLPNEERPLEFKPSAAYLALRTGVTVLPVYTNGKYFTRERTEVRIGSPIDFSGLLSETMSSAESIDAVNTRMRSAIMELGRKAE